MNHRERIGQRIAELRKQRGLTVMQLANQCGVTRQNIYKIEDGKYNVSIDILTKVATALDAELIIQEKAAE